MNTIDDLMGMLGYSFDPVLVEPSRNGIAEMLKVAHGNLVRANYAEAISTGMSHHTALGIAVDTLMAELKKTLRDTYGSCRIRMSYENYGPVEARSDIFTSSCTIQQIADWAHERVGG